MALPTFPTHLTLSPEERTKLGLPEPGAIGSPRSHLLKSHAFPVVYPDGTQGECHYERSGPSWHRFSYSYGGTDRSFSTALPRQYLSHPLGNRPADIEATGKEITDAAFADAIRRERDEHFCRATPPTRRKLDSKAFQFSAKRAKEIGGKYALCLRLGTKLIPASSCLFTTLDEANTAWLEAAKPEGTTLIVGCACRWSRRWEPPFYNPLHREYPELRQVTTE